ncbi:hypothetical protein CVD28_15400 [Bacillus sp. M6-12]|uniref:hypothetical protein n=1 Tax=Bacillus sp. M6-12 TaxID=2054166 RepID=UPI000C793272|nr:hypothetical protein [Bacillus sp. M6-12]PLS16473.1 hypothetical protein CVD28_15400 [Bacillus sp. M6-12]
MFDSKSFSNQLNQMKDIFTNDKDAFMEGVEDLLVVSPLPFDIIIEIRRTITEELNKKVTTFKKIKQTAQLYFIYEQQCFNCGYFPKSNLSKDFKFPNFGWPLKSLFSGK